MIIQATAQAEKRRNHLIKSNESYGITYTEKIGLLYPDLTLMAQSNEDIGRVQARNSFRAKAEKLVVRETVLA